MRRLLMTCLLMSVAGCESKPPAPAPVVAKSPEWPHLKPGSEAMTHPDDGALTLIKSEDNGTFAKGTEAFATPWLDAGLKVRVIDDKGDESDKSRRVHALVLEGPLDRTECTIERRELVPIP